MYYVIVLLGIQHGQACRPSFCSWNTILFKGFFMSACQCPHHALVLESLILYACICLLKYCMIIISDDDKIKCHSMERPNTRIHLYTYKGLYH